MNETSSGNLLSSIHKSSYFFFHFPFTKYSPTYSDIQCLHNFHQYSYKALSSVHNINLQLINQFKHDPFNNNIPKLYPINFQPKLLPYLQSISQLLPSFHDNVHSLNPNVSSILHFNYGSPSFRYNHSKQFLFTNPNVAPNNYNHDFDNFPNINTTKISDIITHELPKPIVNSLNERPTHIVKSRKFQIFPDKSQHIKFIQIMNECTIIYNFCVRLTNHSLFDPNLNNHNNNPVLIDTNDPKYIESKQIMEDFRVQKLNIAKNELIKLNDKLNEMNNKLIELNNKLIELNGKETNLMEDLSKEIKNIQKTHNSVQKEIDFLNDKKDKFNIKYLSGFELRDIIFHNLYRKLNKDVTFRSTIGDVPIKFIANLKSCMTNLKEGYIKNFTMKEKTFDRLQTIYISKENTKIENKNNRKYGYIYKTLIKGPINGLEKLSEYKYLDYHIQYDKLRKKYYAIVPYKCDYKKYTETSDKPNGTIALDPGENIFMSYFSTQGYGHLGMNMRERIMPIYEKIKKYERILKKNKNKKKKRIKNKKRMRTKINNYYEKIKCIVKDLHNKTALYVCKNYDDIILPEFESHQMVRNTSYRKKNMILKETLEKEGLEKMKLKRKELNKKRQLNRKVKFMLNQLSHYKFKEHLMYKALEYGCNVEIVDESFTSMTCTNCGSLSKNYTKDRKKICNCGMSIDRDLNGARNIMIKRIIERRNETLRSKPNNQAR